MKYGCKYIWFLLIGLSLPALSAGAGTAGAAFFADISGDATLRDDVRGPVIKGSQRDYELRVRNLFKRGLWEEGKKVLDEGLGNFESSAVLNQLMGSYWLHHKDFDKARYYLIRSLREEPKDIETLRLLTKVEEETEHYSSAIVYCNQSLEISPYDFDLWRKKISLFRKQGNEAEASRLLKRLMEIYPDREDVRKEVAGDYEIRYREYRKKNNLAGQEAMLRQLVTLVPSDAEFQMALCNLLIQTGCMEDALDVAGRAATVVSDPYPFVQKKASILGEMTRYSEAQAYIQSALASIPALASSRGKLSALSADLAREQARYAAENDPYTAYGKLYAKEHSDEALNYLLNTSMTRGYLDDALTYIREARRRHGDTHNLLYREYTIERRLGDTKAATAMLEEIHSRYPDDMDINEELCALHMEEIRRMMDFQQWNEAAALLEKMSAYKLESDSREAVEKRLFTCYLNAGKLQQALGKIDQVSEDPRTRAGLYEEAMLPYIRQLISKGMLYKAEDEIRLILDKGYPSADVLSVAVSTELSLGNTSEARSLVEEGKSLFPEEPYFLLKDAQLTAAEGDYDKAYAMLDDLLSVYVGDTAMVKAYAECCEAIARRDIKEGEYEEALRMIERGLEADPGNETLILAKTEVYEKLKDWDKAVEAYRLYHPAYGELADYMRHMEGLRRHLTNNQVMFFYQQARPSSEDNITSQASMTYSRTQKRNTYTLGLVFVGRDGREKADEETLIVGGHGIQVNGEWQHQWGSRLGTSLSGAYATKFLPRYKIGLGGTYDLGKGWSGQSDLSYRFVNDSQKASLTGAGLGVTKETGAFSLGAKFNALYLSGAASKTLSSKIFFNGGLTARCYPAEENHSYFYVGGSVGNAPEISLIDNSMPVKFDQLNTMLSAGGLLVVSSMLDIGVSGTWYDMTTSSGSSENANRSRNYLYFSAYVTIHF